jgi:cyanate permease
MQIMSLAAVLFAIPGLLAAPSRPLVIENIRPDAINNSKESNGRKRGIELLLRNRQLIFITFVFSLSGLVINGIQFHHVAAIQTFGFSLATAVSISSARGFLSLPGRAALAYMENQLGTKRALSCVYTMTLISILPFLLEPTLPTMWAFGIIGGLGFGTILPLQGLLASESISDSNFEASLAAQQGAALFIGSFGALTFGALYDLTSNYQIVFLIAAAIQLFAIVLLQFHSRPEK